MSEEVVNQPGVDQEREHSFDGITEFDNRLPNWWLWTFYIACIFSVIYWMLYHVTGLAPLPREQFAREMAALAASEEAASVIQDVTDEALRELANDPAVVERGKQVFAVNCIACHTPNAGGNAVGPNLTDKYWLHGGKPTDIYHTIVNGVAGKAMLAWEPVIGVAKCQQVAAFILTLRNTNVEGGKAPEGEPYEGQ